MVLDTRGMIEHYKRIYNAKPSPEIARTRASSANKKKARKGPLKRSSSFQSIQHQPDQERNWNSDWSNAGHNLEVDYFFTQNDFSGFEHSNLKGYPSAHRTRGSTNLSRVRPMSATLARSSPGGQTLRQAQTLSRLKRLSQAGPSQSRLSSSSEANFQHFTNVSSNVNSSRPNRPFSAHVIQQNTQTQDLRTRHRRLRPSSSGQTVASADQIAMFNPYLGSQYLSSQQAFYHNQVPTISKKYNSMLDLNQDSKTYPEAPQPRRFLSSTSVDQVGMKRTTSLSDRIDSFLKTVQQEQEQLLLKQQMEMGAKRNGRQMYSVLSGTPSYFAGNVSSRKTSTVLSVSSLGSRQKYQSSLRPTLETHQKVLRPPTRQSNMRMRPRRPQSSTTASKVTTRKSTPTPAPVDTSTVTSKLKQDRNYQPPRHRKQSNNIVPETKVKELKKQLMKQRQASSSDNEEYYEDDFEADEDLDDEEEENTDTAMMKKKQDWLYDQFRRVRARQRAAVLIKRQESGIEKASSKDSAYGYSGGETSRMHTREPTPDYHQNVCGVFPGRNSYSNRSGIRHRQIINKSPQHPIPTRQQQPVLVSQPPKEKTEQEGVNPSYIKFLSKVTNDILSSGNFTEQSIKRLLEHHLSNSKEKNNLTKKEVEELIVTLKQELGLETSKNTKGLQAILRSPSSMTKTKQLTNGKPQSIFSSSKMTENKNGNNQVNKLRSKFYQNGQSSSAESQNSNVILPSKAAKTISNPHSIRISISQSLEEDEEQMLKLLRDETDLDDSTVEEIIKVAKSNQNSPSRRPTSSPAKADQKSTLGLFKSLNISNLDVSFNASMNGSLSQLKKREELNQEKAKLIKSFALQGKERSIRALSEEVKKAPAPTGRGTLQKTKGALVPKVNLNMNPKIKIKEEDANQTPRSSMLYQTDEESKENEDLSEEIADEQDSETIGDESVAEDLGASS